MYVDWQRRRLKNELNSNSFNLNAVLVEPYQDQGKTRQKIIEHLGSIGEKFLITRVGNMRAFHQGIFWVTVDKKLEQLNLDSKLINRIEADILKTVSRPDDDWALWGVTCILRFDP